jgi:uncharacterized protein YukE
MSVYSDPERLREFASQLKAYNEFVEAMMASVREATKRLGETWRDPQFEEFETVLGRTRNLLVNFTIDTRQTVEMLKRDAQALEETQNVRLQGGGRS